MTTYYCRYTQAPVHFPNQPSTMNIDLINVIAFKNPIKRFAIGCRLKLAEMINGYFTTEEQQVFIMNFYKYLHFTKYDFVIDLEDVWTMIGFGSKYKAKKMLISRFQVNIDYNVIEFHDSETDQIKQQTLVSVATLECMCIFAKTPTAKTIRKYIVKLHQMLQDLEIDNVLELNQEREYINQQIQACADNRPVVEPLRDMFYIVQIDKTDPDSDLKLGDEIYNDTAVTVYKKPCYDSHLLEEVVHHILKKFSSDEYYDLFTIKKDIAKEVIDIAQLVLDELIPISEHLAKHGVFDKIKAIVEEVKLQENINYHNY